MWNILFGALEGLSVSGAPQLMLALVAAGAVLLVVPYYGVALWAFLVQRFIVLIFLWGQIGPNLSLLSTVALLTITIVSYATMWHLRGARPNALGLEWEEGALGSVLFRVLALVLAALLTFGLVRARDWPLSFNVAFSVIWLLMISVFGLLLGDGGLRTGLAVLTFADAGRVLYALWGPSVLVWGIWSACDILVALAACYLYSTRFLGDPRISGRVS